MQAKKFLIKQKRYVTDAFKTATKRAIKKEQKQLLMLQKKITDKIAGK